MGEGREVGVRGMAGKVRGSGGELIEEETVLTRGSDRSSGDSKKKEVIRLECFVCVRIAEGTMGGIADADAYCFTKEKKKNKKKESS